MATKKAKTPVKKNYSVFLSHSSKDRWIAGRMADAIEQQGKAHKVKVIINERDIAAGDDITEWIRDNIIESEELLVLLSSFSVKRSWVVLEIGVALGHKKLIVPIIDKIALKEVPDALIKFDAKDLNNFDDYLKQMTGRASKFSKGKRK